MSAPITTSLVTVVLLVAAAAPAAAQSAQKEKAEQTATAPSTETFLGLAGPQAVQFVVDATEKNKNATVAFGWNTGQHNSQLSFSGPIDEKSGESTPLSLLGLPPGASAKFSYSRLSTGGPNPLEQQQIFDLCKKHGLWPPSDTVFCNADTIPAEDAALFAFLQHTNDAVWLVGGEAAMARSKFAYVDSSSFAPVNENHQGWSVSGRLGRFSPTLGFLIGSYSYKRSFEAGAPPTELCSPIDSHPTSLRCRSAVIGAPTEVTRSLATIELRHFFKDTLATTPSVQYDFKNDVTGIDVPIYFIGKGTSATGGVRFGWRSDTDELSTVLFIGAAIGLLPK